MQVVFLPSSLYVSLLFEGIIWFLLPTALVIVNDIMAYLAGGGAAAFVLRALKAAARCTACAPRTRQVGPATT